MVVLLSFLGRNLNPVNSSWLGLHHLVIKFRKVGALNAVCHSPMIIQNNRLYLFFDLQVIFYGQMTLIIINSILFKQFVIDSLPLMGRYFCKQISPIWLNNRDVQGLNKVRWPLGQKNKFGTPMFEPEFFRKQCRPTVLKKVVMTLWHSPPAVIQRPLNFSPLLPSFPPMWCAIKVGKYTNFQIRTSWTSIPWTSVIFERNTAWLCKGLHPLPTKVTAFQVSWCSFYVTSMPAPRVFSAWTCVCFANNKTFPTFNKCLMRQNRQYHFSMNYLELFGVLTGVDVSNFFGVGAGTGVLKRGAGAESESEKCESAHLWRVVVVWALSNFV